MAINRKGMRKIVVGGETFYYKISTEDWFGDYTLKVLIEYPNGRIKTHKVHIGSRYTEFTPKNVSELIMMNLTEVSL